VEIAIATSGTLARSYQMCGSASLPEIFITSAAFTTSRFAFGDARSNLSIEIVVTQAILDHQLRLAHRCSCFRVSLELVRSAVGSRIDVSSRLPPRSAGDVSPHIRARDDVDRTGGGLARRRVTPTSMPSRNRPASQRRLRSRQTMHVVGALASLQRPNL
jgi:hypothetical protein